MMEPQLLKENGGNEGEDIYETIEAPKFVDFTAPDKSCPDDRYWFCSRFGCDQKHEEEMDAETIYKNFVMRVMAARSPNVRRFRKAPRNVKCPLTAPPKSSKSRLSKLTLISSVSKKIVDSRVKAKPLLARTRITQTPAAEAKQSSALPKALTTPRNGKRVSIPRKFLSVRNVKGHSVSAPKTLKVVKSLAFNSPKKSAKTKANELDTPMRTLCAAMKKLEISNGNKYESLPSDAGKKKPRGREVKSRVFDSLYSHKLKCKNVKLSSHSRRKSKEKLSQNRSMEPKKGEEVKDDSSDMEMDGNSRHGSNGHEDLQKNLEVSEIESDKNIVSSTAEPDAGQLLDDNSRHGSNGHEDLQRILQVSEIESDKTIVSSTAEPDAGQLLDDNSRHGSNGHEDLQRILQVSEIESDKNIASSTAELDVGQLLDEGELTEFMESDDKEDAGKENESRNAENLEKENTVSSDNRKLNPRDGNSGKVTIFGKHDNSKTMIKVKKGLRNPSKENSSVAFGGQGLKNMKPKPTYPKPFRLRTDERGILREANMMEKKIHPPSCEMTHSEKLQVEKPQKLKKNCLGEYGKKKHKEEEEEREKKSQAAQLETIQPISAKKTSKEPISACTIKKQRKTRTGIEKSKQESERSKTDKVQKQLARHHGNALSRKEMVSRAPSLGILAASSGPTPRQTTRKRTLTVPKGPNFHSIHVPKSCTRKLT